MSRTNTEHWPTLLKQFAELIGPEATLKVARLDGGRDGFYIPEKFSDGHRWIELIGREACDTLAAAFGGQRISIPSATLLGSLKAKIIDRLERGLGTHEIAQELGCTDRYVRDVRSRYDDSRVDPRQTNLFD